MKKLLALFLIVFSFSAHAEERILSYRSDIAVQPDASVLVRENITVNVEGVRVRRGIYRDLPRNKGERYHIESVFRNGVPEPFFTENINGTLRVNTGGDDFIPRETTTFTLVYRVQNVIKAFDGYDEIYWNVTGNDWIFPIDEASATITLPNGASIVRQASYIGARGAKTPARYAEGRFAAPRPLRAGEGLTIAVGFSKGAVDLSALPHRFDFWTAAGILGAYMLLTGLAVGRAPSSGLVMPRFDGITGFTPAEASRVYSLGADTRKTLTLAILQAVASGFCSFAPDSRAALQKNRAPTNDEERILDKFLTFPLTLDGSYNPALARAQTALVGHVRKKTRDCLKTNTKFTIIGALLSILLLTKGTYDAQTPILLVYFAFYLPFFCAAAVMLRQMFKIRKFHFAAVFITGFVTFHFTVMMIATTNGFPPITAFYLLSVFALPIYGALIKHPTERGREIIDHIDGIKLFLSSQTRISAERTEKLLPYAVLLGMEREWSGKIEQMQTLPDWVGRESACFCRNIERSSTPPAVVRGGLSASSGGGCSGGGHGGGGGGGR